jgi:hypothetical protein
VYGTFVSGGELGKDECENDPEDNPPPDNTPDFVSHFISANALLIRTLIREDFPKVWIELTIYIGCRKIEVCRRQGAFEAAASISIAIPLLVGKDSILLIC